MTIVPAAARPAAVPSVGRGARALAAGTVLLGLLTLLGWMLDQPGLKTGFSRGWAMNPLVAAVFVLCGISLWISAAPAAGKAIARSGQACAVVVILVCLYRVLQLWLGWSYQIDLALFSAAVARDPAGQGLRLNAGTASILGLLGLSLFLVARPGATGRLTARAIGVFLAVVAGIASLAYVGRRGALTGSNTTVPASLTLGLCLLFMSIGVWLVGSRDDSSAAPVPIDALRHKVRIAFGVALTILILAASLSVWGSVRSAEAGRQRQDGYSWRVELSRLLFSVREAETGQRGYLLTGAAGPLASYRTALDSIPASLKRVAALAAADSQQAGEVAQVADLSRLIDEKTAELDATIDLKQAGRVDSAIRLVGSGRGSSVMDSIKTRVAGMLAAKEKHVAMWDNRLAADNRVSLFANLVAGLLAVTFLSLAGVAINRDLTQRSRAESAVRESERRLAQMIELIPNMVFLKEPKDLRFVHFNKAGEELLGFSRDALIGKNDFDFFPEAEARQFVAKDREVLARQDVVDIPEELIHTRDRGVRILHTKKVAVRNEQDEPIFLLGISEDVTERKQAEAAIREAKDAAELANQAKSGFLAKMSHELRTPLNSIIGFSEILEEGTIGPLTDKQQRYVGNVLLSGRNLLQLINDILDLSKVEAGRMELSFAPFDVGAALEEIRGVLSALADKKQQKLTVKVEPGMPPLLADRAKVAQVLYNLVGNAIKFTGEHGSIEVAGRLSWREQDSDNTEWLEVSVTDTGIGIAPENLERIFGEFEQVGRGGAAETGGTGLGLALSRKLVELHGGTIAVESTPGQGSTFRFRLPVRREDAVAIPAAPAGGNGAGPLALVVDDEVQARDLLSHYLSESGFRVATAGGGREAVRSAAAMQPDVITLDILMPDRDGFVTLSELKKSPETSGIPVVVVSVSDQRELGFSLGAADWLVKPVQRSDLLAALERTVDQPSGGTGPGVLVVDDDPATLEYLQDLLQEDGYEVRVALGGREGVRQAIEERPGLIILDLLMPDLNGFDVVRQLRDRADTTDIPIVILTAKDLTESDLARLRQSVQGIVPKGGREELLAELARICRRPPARH